MAFKRLLLILVAAVALAAVQTPPAPKAGAGPAASGKKSSLAQKIIAARPYRAKTDLVTRKVIPSSTYEKIKGQIVARQKK